MPAIATRAELERHILHFVKSLERGIRVEAVVLYGSYVHGEPHVWSDIDLAVISPDFEGVPVNERQSTLAGLAWRDTDVRIEAIGYPSSEYHNPRRHSFLREIIRTGRVVYEAPG
jgi:predicted nucleotidyltransferase